MESVETIPYLLGASQLYEKTINKFNALKKKQDPNFVPLEYIHQIRNRPEIRADKLWSRLVPKENREDEDMDGWDPRYVLVPLEMAPYVVINEYDGSEWHSIDYNKYGINKIQEILGNTNDADKLSAIQEVINKVIYENNKVINNT